MCSTFLKETPRLSPTAIIKIENQSAKTSSYSEDIIFNANKAEQFLTTLFQFSKEKEADNLTASRVEERYIAKTERINDLIQNSSLNWNLRDPKPEGLEFTTITAYASKVILPLPNNTKGNVKVRMRKYYRHSATETPTPANVEEVFRDFTVLELKVSGITKTEDATIAPLTDSVYKVRAFIHDSVIEKIIKFGPNDYFNKEKIETLIDQISNTPYGNELFNNREEVRQLFESLVVLGQANKNIFNIQTVISYNRDSYSTSLTDGNSYQLTIDRNIQIFSAKDIKVSRLADYLQESPSHSVPTANVFVELKSPITAIENAVPSYTELNNYLLGYHIEGVERSGGKFSLSQKTNEFKLEKAFELYQQNTLSSQLSSEGILYFLIKGTSNLPAPPNRKKVVEQGEVSIAIPFVVENQTYRAILDYKPYILNGERYGFIDKFTVIDQAGKKVELGSKIQLEIPTDVKADLPPTQILINNERIAFPNILSPSIMNQYKEFFSQFYTNYSKLEGNPREIEELITINSNKELQNYIFKMKLGNSMSYLWSRFHRVATQAVIIAGVSASVTYFTWEYKEAQETPQKPTPILQETTVRTHLEAGTEIQSINGHNRFLIVKGTDGELIAIPIDLPVNTVNNAN